jgi:ADP-ribosylation factor-like protein 5B
VSYSQLTRSQELRSSLLLVLANKQDLPAEEGRLTPAQVSEALGLTDLREREWQIMGCSALTGLGLMEGMDWLVTKLEAK